MKIITPGQGPIDSLVLGGKSKNTETKIRIHSTGEGYGILFVEQGSKMVSAEMPVDYMRAFAGAMINVAKRESAIVVERVGEIVGGI